MPHVTVKMLPGRSPAQKQALTEAITLAVTTHAGCGADAVSVDIVDVPAEAWTAQVYTPEIRARWEHLAKRPGYAPD